MFALKYSWIVVKPYTAACLLVDEAFIVRPKLCGTKLSSPTERST